MELGGSVVVESGTSTGDVGGQVAITTASGKASGDVSISSGRAQTWGASGKIILATGDARDTVGTLSIQAGDSETGVGASVIFVAGDSAASQGGLLRLAAGDGASAGHISLNAGAGIDAAGGNLEIFSGTQLTRRAGKSGDVTIKSAKGTISSGDIEVSTSCVAEGASGDIFVSTGAGHCGSGGISLFVGSSLLGDAGNLVLGVGEASTASGGYGGSIGISGGGGNAGGAILPGRVWELQGRAAMSSLVPAPQTKATEEARRFPQAMAAAGKRLDDRRLFR